MARKVNDYAVIINTNDFDNNLSSNDDELDKLLTTVDNLNNNRETRQSLIVTDSNYTDSLTLKGNTNIVQIDLSVFLTNDWTPTDITGVVEGRRYIFEIIKRKTNVGVDLSTVRALGHVGYNDDINPFIELSGISNNQRAVINGIGLANGMVQFDTLIITDSGYYEDIINITFSSATINNDNSIITLSFSDGAWGANDSTTPLALSSMTYTFNISGGTASGWTATSITGVSGTTLTGGETTVEIHGSISGTSDGNEVITIEPVSVYSSTGTAMDSNESINVNLTDQYGEYTGNFDGSNIYGTIPHTSDLNLSYHETEIKFNLDNIQYSGLISFQAYDSDGNDASQDAGFIIRIGSDGYILYKYSRSVGSTYDSLITPSGQISGNTDYVLNVKHFSGTNGIVMSLNGVQIISSTYNDGVSYRTQQQTKIGVEYFGATPNNIYFMDGIQYYVRVWELDSSGNRTNEKLFINYQNGPQGTTEDNDAINAPAGTTMTWQGVSTAGDQYRKITPITFASNFDGILYGEIPYNVNSDIPYIEIETKFKLGNVGSNQTIFSHQFASSNNNDSSIESGCAIMVNSSNVLKWEYARNDPSMIGSFGSYVM